MARPHKDGPLKDRVLAIRISQEEHRVFGREARKLSMDTSAWARMWLRYGAHLVKFIPRTVRGDELVKEK